MNFSQFTNDSIAAMHQRQTSVKSDGRATFGQPQRTERRAPGAGDPDVRSTGGRLQAPKPGFGGNRKKTWKRNKKQGDPADDDQASDDGDTVYKTLYEDQPAPQAADRPPQDGPNVRTSRFEDDFKANHPSDDEDINTNMSRAKSQLSDKLMRQVASEDYESLKAYQIIVEGIVEYWPTYFNESKPNFNPKNYRQALAITILVALIEDFESKSLQYVQWNRKKNEQRCEVTINLAKGPTGRPLTGERLSKVLDYLEEFPQDILGALGVGLHVFNHKVLQSGESSVFVRLLNPAARLPLTPFPGLTASKTHRFLVIRGRLTLLAPPKLVVLSTVFTCKDCGRAFVRHFRDGVFSSPSRCDDPECSGKTFAMDKPKSKVAAMQRFVVQETGADRNRLMAVVNCEVHDALMTDVRLNKVALIAGVWKIEPSAKVGNKIANTKGMYDHYLEVKHLEYPEGADDHQLVGQVKASFSSMIKEAITLTLVDCPLSFYILTANFCPNIQGQEFAKACIILGLVGAANPAELFTNAAAEQDPGVAGSFKSNVHVLLLGERGIGKTELLKYVESLSPNNNYFEGRVADSARLTSRSVKDASGEVQVNPGLLPLSHKGVCCIDGLDKIEQIETSIVEVIERRRLSVAKKGGFDDFPCDTTIIAAAEPRNNKLTAKKSVLENFMIDECLLNKFDLVVLFVEEEKKKQTLNLKRELGLKEVTQDFRQNNREENRIERIAGQINKITENIDELLAMASENDGGTCSNLYLLQKPTAIRFGISSSH